MSKKQLFVSVLCLSYSLNFKSYCVFLFFKSVILKVKVVFTILIKFLFLISCLLFSYSLLIVLNRSGLFNIIPSRDDENRVEFFNRAHCFRYLNRINPSCTMF